MRKTEEQAAPDNTARATSSRSGMEFDGPSDSPIPSPADNRQARKFGSSRTGSQPPSRPDGTPSEGSDKAKQPKIVYEKGQEVAFKRKTPGKPEEQDWIQGRVVRVIGEGKSRRYDVEDPYPDNKEENGPPPAPIIYKSSASQMVPIPPEGSDFKDYEIGRRVLALYPETTTFYRAEVKAILNDGADVQLLFEDEAAGELKIVTRRLVLDHKG
jgi:SAGA-associated factor 29